MSEKKPADEARTKFLDALDKKKQKGVAGTGVGPDSGSKVGGAAGTTSNKRSARKSGSA